MARWRVLVSAPYAMGCLDRYRRELEAGGCEVIVAPVDERLEEAELLRLLPGVHGIICGDDRITARVLDAATDLRVISKWGTGIDSIDVEAARRRGIPVRNTPNAFSEPVADTVFGYMLLFVRQLGRMNEDMQQGRWQKPQLRALNELTLGVIGVGNCGTAVVRRAVAFGMRVLGCDVIAIPEDFRRATGLEQVPLDALLRTADVVSINCTLTATSYHLMDRARFALIKTGAFLINTARGPIVEEAALVEALAGGRLGGAALDVFEQEPLPADSRLRTFPHCYLGPHNANSSSLAAERVHQRTIAALFEELRAADVAARS